MSRDSRPSAIRCLVVWLAVSGIAGACWLLALPAVGSITTGRWTGFDDVLVSLAAIVALATTAWLWAIATVTVVQLATGRVPSRISMVRRLVLIACGAAIVATTGVASQAAGTDTSLDGLRMPERAVGAGAQRPSPIHEPVRSRDITVQAGDSLWSIAASTLPADATDQSIERQWRSLYAANRASVGADPHLIHPGLNLQAPNGKAAR